MLREVRKAEDGQTSQIQQSNLVVIDEHGVVQIDEVTPPEGIR
jgi:hypothetical protein